MADVERLASGKAAIDKPGVEDVAVAAVESDRVDSDFRRLDCAANPAKAAVVIRPPVKCAGGSAALPKHAAEG